GGCAHPGPDPHLRTLQSRSGPRLPHPGRPVLRRNRSVGPGPGPCPPTGTHRLSPGPVRLGLRSRPHRTTDERHLPPLVQGRLQVLHQHGQLRGQRQGRHGPHHPHRVDKTHHVFVQLPHTVPLGTAIVGGPVLGPQGRQVPLHGPPCDQL